MRFVFSAKNLHAELNCGICTRPVQFDLSGALANLSAIVQQMLNGFRKNIPDSETIVGGMYLCEVCKPIAIKAIEAAKKQREARGKALKSNGRK